MAKRKVEAMLEVVDKGDGSGYAFWAGVALTSSGTVGLLWVLV